MHKVEWWQESDRASCKHDGNHHENGVAKVENNWNQTIQAMQIKDEVADGIQEDV